MKVKTLIEKLQNIENKEQHVCYKTTEFWDKWEVVGIASVREEDGVLILSEDG